MSNNFEFFSPTKVLFGTEMEKQTGKQIKAFGGKNVLIVYGSERVRKNGLMERVLESLDLQEISYILLGGVVPNPHLDLVYKGIELGKERQVDFVLAVGGGSTIDTAKAIAYGLAEPEYDVWELFAHTRKAKACLAVGSVLTIAAAGSETSMGSVITNEVTADKRAYDDDLARPKFAIMNPELTFNLPDYQTESGCTDMMMHTMERYFTNGGNLEITDMISEGLMRNIMKYAKILHKEPDNYEARAEVMWSGSLAHNNLTGCGNDGGDFSSHKLEHEIGGMFDVTHGAGLSAIWGSWARYVYKNCLHRFVRFAVEVHHIVPDNEDEVTALMGIKAQEEFYKSIGMPISLKELGITPSHEQLKEMAKRCSIACGGKSGSAKVLEENDMYEIYKMAL
ncbi:MAG: iron-containing alcohol dehydrogenase [Anaerostipes sp.]